MARTVLVTGVSRHLGGSYAQKLSEDPSIERIIGVDVVPPPHDIGRAEFVRADIRNPTIGRVMTQAKVDTVVHMSVIATPTSAGGRASQKEINVIGTMQLLAACQKSDTIERLVVKSSTSVYGSSPRDPALFTEDMNPKAMPRLGFGKDSVEVEGYVRGFSRRRPDVDVSMLRFANAMGPRIHTALTDYFALPMIPAQLGFDARLQFLHEDDLTSAMVLATTGPAVGIVNVAGDGFLTLSQCAAILGRPVFPVIGGTGLIGSTIKRWGIAEFPTDQLALLAYGRGVDTTRMRALLGFEPEYTTRETFDDYARVVGPPIPGIDAFIDVYGGAAATVLTGISRLVRKS